MKVGLIQFDSGDNIQKNIAVADKLLIKAAKHGCEVVCFPEIFLHEGKEEHHFEIHCEEIKHFQDFARKNGIVIILGSVLLKNTKGYVTNTCFVIDNAGEIVYRYDKIKMFKTFREDYYFDESETTRAGQEVGIFKLGDITVGVAICFDLRFSDIFREMAKRGAQIIFLPSCFRKSTGWNAWTTLPEARAIENQVYFCACSQSGGDGVREKCGHSRIVDFQGNVLAKATGKECLVVADIDFQKQQDYRKRLPVLSDL